jgi:hypothetical protein
MNVHVLVPEIFRNGAQYVRPEILTAVVMKRMAKDCLKEMQTQLRRVNKRPSG